LGLDISLNRIGKDAKREIFPPQPGAIARCNLQFFQFARFSDPINQIIGVNTVTPEFGFDLPQLVLSRTKLLFLIVQGFLNPLQMVLLWTLLGGNGSVTTDKLIPIRDSVRVGTAIF